MAETEGITKGAASRSVRIVLDEKCIRIARLLFWLQSYILACVATIPIYEEKRSVRSEQKTGFERHSFGREPQSVCFLGVAGWGGAHLITSFAAPRG